MASILDSASQECMKSELELFHVHDTQASLGNYRYVKYYPITSLDRGGPLEIVIQGNSDTYFDLNDTYLFLDFNIVDASGSSITKVTETSSANYNNQLVAPVNLFHSSFFRSAEIYLNSKLVSQTDNLYPYKAYIQNLTTYSKEAKETFLSRSIYYEDTGTDLDTFDNSAGVSEESEIADAVNKGLAKRFLISRNSKSFSSFGKIYSEIFQQLKLIPGDNEIRIKLHRSDPSFCLHAKSELRYEINIDKAILYVKQFEIPAHIREAHAKVHKQINMKFPVKHVEMKFFTKGANRVDLSEQNLVTGTLPRKCYICLVESDSFNGKVTKNPFNFKHFSVSEITLRKNGTAVPYEKISVDFENNKYDEGYFSLLQSSGLLYSNGGPNISYDQFANGYAIYGFDFSSDPSPYNRCLDLIQEGKLSLDISLKTSTSKPLTIIVYLEYDKVIEIDKDKNVTTNYE